MSRFGHTDNGDWSRFCNLPNHRVVDFHWSRYGPRRKSYGERMGEVYETALDALVKAYEDGVEYVLFTHGYSTSRPGQTTARSTVRALMRSKEATQYIIRRDCIQNNAVFVAAIRPNPSGAVAYQEKLENEYKELISQISAVASHSIDEAFKAAERTILASLVQKPVTPYLLDKLRHKLSNYRNQLSRKCGVFAV